MEKKYVEIQTFDLLGHRKVKTFFLVQMFLSPMGYLASNVLNAPPIFLVSIEVP